MRISIVVIIIGVLLAADVLAWLLARRALRGQATWLRTAVGIFFLVQGAYVATLLAMMASGLFHSRNLLPWIPKGVLAIFYIWHMVFLPLVLLLWAARGTISAGRGLGRRLAGEKSAAQAESPSAERQGMTRRGLLVASLAAVPPLLSIGAAGCAMGQISSFRVRKLRLPVAGLPATMEGLRIAQVSDLHVGRWTSQAFLNEVVQATNAINADMVLFTGDLIDVSISDLPQAIEAIKRMRSMYGTYLIEGNHDLIDDAAAFRQAIRHEGLNFLRGESRLVEHRGERMQLMGLPWSRLDGRMQEDVHTLASKRDTDAFPILLAHHPHAFDAAAANGLPLTLSGHTHGGQIAFNRELNAGMAFFRYISGLYQQGISKLLVSNGTGNWFPLRVNAPAEIIDLTLVRG